MRENGGARDGREEGDSKHRRNRGREGGCSEEADGRTKVRGMERVEGTLRKESSLNLLGGINC